MFSKNVSRVLDDLLALKGTESHTTVLRLKSYPQSHF
jgi:hypothetical protein